MTETPPADTPRHAARTPAKGPRWGRVAAWTAGVAAGLAALAAVAAVGIDTRPGHDLLRSFANRAAPANGLRVGLAAIDGSIYGRMTLRGLTLSDPKGVFLSAPALTVAWRPGALLQKHLLFDEASADTMVVRRAPVLKPGPPPKPGQPTLPDLYLTLNRLHVGALVLEPALTGDRRSMSIDGSAELLHGRARIDAAALAQGVGGQGGGDRLTLKLDAAPDQNRLAVDAHLLAPGGGVVDRLMKLNAPLRFDLTGRGDWQAWQGRADAALGGRSLLAATLDAKTGRFSADGTVQPGLTLKGPPADLTAPALRFALAGTLKDRQLDGEAHLGSDAIALDATGRLDLARSRYVGVRAAARLKKPEAASPMMNGRGVALTVALDGDFARPVIDYDLRAAQIGFDKTGVEGLHAQGKARVDAQNILRLPVHATAARVTGVDAAVGGLVTNLKVDGDVAISAKQIASDNLRLRSDRLDATLVMALSLDTGRYDAALKGRINRYAVQGLGLVDVVTDARLVPTGRGQFRIAGHVHGQTLRIDNPSAADFLGGNAVVDADFSRTPEGAFGVAGLRLTAPKLRVLNGQGSLGVAGQLAFTLNAVSQPYGPARLDVGGTIAAPTVRLRAPSPNVGVPLTNVDVLLKGTGPGAYRVTAAGGTPYGPFSAEVALRAGKGPLEADIRRASLAGLNLSGQVRQTAAGPFAGTVALAGLGLNGTVRLAGAGKVQRADLALRAADARLPLTPAVTIGRGVVNASAILYPQQPEVTATAALSDLRQGQLTLANARLEASYRQGRGSAQLSADGRSAVPFKFTAKIDGAPQMVVVDAQGTVNRIDLRLAAPARIAKEADGYRLAPATLVLPQGRVDLSGLFGARTSASARIDNLDLSIVQAVAPDLGLNGKASGTLDLALPAGGAAPTGKAELQIAGFNRTGLAVVAEPVDLSLLGTLNGSGAEAHAVVRRRGAVIGRLQMRLGPPAGGSGPWTDRLKTAPLSGGLRYNGPSEALWALGGIAGQSVSGPIAIGADVSGKLDRPQITGVIRTQALRYENAAYGTVIDQIALDGRFTGSRFDIGKLSARAGRGTINASGYADLSAASGYPVDIRVRLADAQLARSNDVNAVLDGDLKISNTKAEGAQVTGDLTIDQARYQIVRQAAADVPDLDGVRRKGQLMADAPALDVSAPGGPPSVWKLNIGVHAPERLIVTGMGLDAEWGSDLRITGDAAHPVIVGDVRLVRGAFSFAGRELTLSRGTIHLDGSTPPNPTLDIEASTTVEGVTATIDITGTALSPQIAFTSTPTLPQDEVLSRLLFGSSVTQLSPIQAVQLAAALNSLRGSGGGLNPMGKLRQAAGVDRLRFYGADKTSGRGPSVGAGKYIAKNIYVEITTDARGFTATQIEIALSRTLRLLSQVSSFGSSNLSLRYSHDY